MDLSFTEEQEHLREVVSRFLAKSSSPERVRSAEPLGFDATVWHGLVDIGVVAMGVPSSAGGMDASMADLTVVAEAAGAALAPAPLVEAMVAARLLARVAPESDWLAGVVNERRLVTFCPRLIAADERLARMVPGAAVADAAVLQHGSDLVVVPLPERDRPSSPPNLPHAPLADVDLSSERTVLAAGEHAQAAFAAAMDEWRVLTASWLAGLGRSALSLGVDYARERVQFGVPIGSFQAVQHRLADAATALNAAALVAAKAAWAIDHHHGVAPRTAVMALASAGPAAEEAAGAALHFHGGYGFMEEYDIQLYFRRAKAARLVLGDPGAELQLLADRLFPDGHVPATIHADLGAVDPAEPRTGPELRLTTEEHAFRQQVHGFLAEHGTSEVIEEAYRTGTMHAWGLHRQMAAEGWISAGWPKSVGGGGRSPLEMNALSEEMYLSGLPVDGMGIVTIVAHTLLLEGTDWQRDTIVPELLSGEKIVCLGYSEPEAGSDVAACTTRAVRDGDGWIINGQKMFTTLAHEASYVFLLTRTSGEGSKHRGLTMFVVPLDSPGIEITPVATMGGERTNITFYTDVRVDDRYRVGEVGAGWKVLMTALVFERNGSWYGELVRMLDHAVHWAAQSTGPDGRPQLANPRNRERLARIALGAEAANLLSWRSAWLQSTGVLPTVEGSMAKLFVTEQYRQAADELMDMLGVEALRRHEASGAAADGWIEHTYRHCQVTTIYGGSSEVQRNIIAQRGLGLPRGR